MKLDNKEYYSPVLLVVSALRMNDLYVQKGCQASSGMYAIELTYREQLH